MVRYKGPASRDPRTGAAQRRRVHPVAGVIEGRQYRVRLHGDLLADVKGRASTPTTCRHGGRARRPTGDCIEGGTFYSWFAAK